MTCVCVKRRSCIVLLFLAVFVCARVYSDTPGFRDTLEQIDSLLEADNNDEALRIIDRNFNDNGPADEKGRLLWRRARAEFNKADLGYYRGFLNKSQARDNFEASEKYADMAIENIRIRGDQQGSLDKELEKELARAYFWKTANIGMMGQLRGVLNSLFKAGDMRDILKKAIQLDPDYSNSYYILGQLYEQLPGAPISFGDDYFAVSFGRAAVDLHEKDLEAGRVSQRYYDYYTELARHLWERNWKSKKRIQEQSDRISTFRDTADQFEKMKYYEASIVLDTVSDRDEAINILIWVVSEMKNIEQPGTRLERDLEKARGIARDWNITLP